MVKKGDSIVSRCSVTDMAPPADVFVSQETKNMALNMVFFSKITDRNEDFPEE